MENGKSNLLKHYCTNICYFLTARNYLSDRKTFKFMEIFLSKQFQIKEMRKDSITSCSKIQKLEKKPGKKDPIQKSLPKLNLS